MKTAKKRTRNFRTERDPLGEKEVPAESLFGVQTFRALENFRISPLRIHTSFFKAYAEIKKAAALANRQTGKLGPRAAKRRASRATERRTRLYGRG